MLFSWRACRWWTLVGLFFSIVGCDCGDPIRSQDPTKIDIVYPQGSLIQEGRFRVRIRDNDGIGKVIFYANGAKIDAKEGNQEKDLTLEATFNLEAQPNNFTLKVETTDITEETASKELPVRKDISGPQVLFLLPAKLQAGHPTIFVGRKTEVEVEANDPDGVKEIYVEFGQTKDEQKPWKACPGSGGAGVSDKCKDLFDLSDDTLYPDGSVLAFYASAKDQKENPTVPKVRLEVLIDKAGPQLRILKPASAGLNLRGFQEFRALALDQAGVKSMEFFIAGKPLTGLTTDPQKPGEYAAQVDVSTFGSGELEFKVVAKDELDNASEATLKFRTGCQNDTDCQAGERCCLGTSPSNKDGKLSGQCFKTQDTEGNLCDPCTQPCGKGGDGKLMGCLPEPCTTEPPYRCRSSCNLGNPNLRPDKCKAANPATGQPAEYCTRSDITAINPQLGACALGHNCNPLNQQTCPAGARPPYNNCCPAGQACFPADDDANFCVPEGNKRLGEGGCSNDICSGQSTCERGGLCVVTVDAQGRPIGAPTCRKMCNCDQICQAGFPSQGVCGSGQFCTPLVLTNGRVPLPVGACSGL